MGSWVTYALGSQTENLPEFVVLPDPRGLPPGGIINWGSGFLPAVHQGTVMEIGGSAEAIGDLFPARSMSAQSQQRSIELLQKWNREHSSQRQADTLLEARIASFELAGKLQMSVPEVVNLEQETEATHRLYGTDDRNPLKAAYARNCLLSRRLLEKGVRYVSLYCASRASGVDGLLNWDAHRSLKTDYERHCPIFDQPTAALLTDLKERGMLRDTLVLWVTEFGRMPTHQEGTTGRDHNPDGFTLWMMGAGVRGGTSYGATDELGRRAVENVATVYDFYATVLHLLGLDHERLTWYHNGMNRRLTDVHGHVIREVLA